MSPRALGWLAALTFLGCKGGAPGAGADGGAAVAPAVDAAAAAVAKAPDAAARVIDAAVIATPPDARPADARPADARPADARPTDAAGVVADASAPAPSPVRAPEPAADAAVAAAAPDAAAGPPDAARVTQAPPPAGGDEIIIDEPRVVGDVDVQPILDALGTVKPQLEGCRPRGAEVAKVKVQFHVGLGKLGLAAPAADNTGDASVARCIANRVKSAKPAFKEGESGIIIVEASVPPRK